MRLLLTLALLATPTFAAHHETDAEVRELVAAYAAARESRDPAAIDKLFADDADQLVSTGAWRHGKQSLVKGMLGSSRSRPGQRTITVETVRTIADGVAIADARYIIKGTGGAPDRKMWSTFVAIKTNQGWRLTAIRNMLPRE